MIRRLASLPAALALAGALVALTQGGCATVQSSLAPGYAAYDRTHTVRLRIAIAPLPGESEAVGRLWARIARKHVNDRRDFIARTEVVGAASETPCEPEIEGVLLIAPQLHRTGSGVEGTVRATLRRCDGTFVWSSETGASFRSDDPLYTETSASYVATFGDEVAPWVAPAFRFVQAVLEPLPRPELDDAGVMEKIELAD